MKNISLVKYKSELGGDINYNIEGVKIIGASIIIHGWVVDPNNKLDSIAVRAIGNGLVINIKDIAVKFHREDVVSAFGASGSTVDTHYGFVSVLSNFESVVELDGIGVAAISKNGNVHVDTIKISRIPASVDSLSILSGIFTDSKIDKERCEKFYVPIFCEIIKASAKSNLCIDENYGDSTHKFDGFVSIIIPLYGSTRFETTQIPALAAVFGNKFEIIFSIDDPRIVSDVCRNVDRLACLYGISVRVIAVSDNIGFSGINNAAAEVANGDYLLFLNSDCFISNGSPIEKALDWLRSESSAGAVGFRLTYADRAIQHDGMSVSKWNHDNDFILNDHPRMGLPVHLMPQSSDGDAACMLTAACLLMRKETFKLVGGFDRAYLRGDFEDSDLCLKLISRDLRLAIVRDEGIFHLERQTIEAQEGGLRQRITLVNSYIYTKKWGHILKSGMKPLEVIV